MRRADAAIVGRLVEVVPRAGFRADYRYRVLRVYKGDRRLERDQIVSVRSSSQSASCGLPHGVGRSYGLFLTWDRGRWTGGLCGVVKPRRLQSAAWRGAPGRPRAPESVGGCSD